MITSANSKATAAAGAPLFALQMKNVFQDCARGGDAAL
jgi:hypothetical protein